MIFSRRFSPVSAVQLHTVRLRAEEDQKWPSISLITCMFVLYPCFLSWVHFFYFLLLLFFFFTLLAEGWYK